MSLFAAKSVEYIMTESESGEHKVRRTLGPGSLIALGIGAITVQAYFTDESGCREPGLLNS